MDKSFQLFIDQKLWRRCYDTNFLKEKKENFRFFFQSISDMSFDPHKEAAEVCGKMLFLLKESNIKKTLPGFEWNKLSPINVQSSI